MADIKDHVITFKSRIENILKYINLESQDEI